MGLSPYFFVLFASVNLPQKALTRPAIEPVPGCRRKAGPPIATERFSFFVASFPADRGLCHV
jgi:hypothetical protein